MTTEHLESRRSSGKERAIEALTMFKHNQIANGFNAMESAGINKVRLVAANGSAVSMSLKSLRKNALEWVLGINDYNITFSPIGRYPHLIEEYMACGVNLSRHDIVHSSVFYSDGHIRCNSAQFNLTGVIVFRATCVEIFGDVSDLLRKQNFSSDEQVLYAKRFTSAIGRNRAFHPGRCEAYCDRQFTLYRYEELSAHSPTVSSTHTLQEWMTFSENIRLSHDALLLRESPLEESGNYNFSELKWGLSTAPPTYLSETQIWATGEVRSRYDGSIVDIEIIRQGDPVLADSLLGDGITRDITYKFEYRFNFNSLGKIQEIHLYRDCDKMRKCYALNSADIDAVLMAATRSAYDAQNGAMADQIIQMSKDLYEAEKKELAITRLFKAIEIANDKDMAVEAMGHAIYKMVSEK